MNTLSLKDLRTKIRKGNTKCVLCNERKATDIHHLNNHHHDHQPENLAPTCKKCHDEHHGISAQLNDLALVVRQFNAIQDFRVAMNNRIQAYARIDYSAEHAREVHDATKKLEEHIKKVITKLVKVEPIYDTWLQHVEGLGPVLSAGLITRIGNVHRFESVSAIWAYAGMHVVDGKAPRRRKGHKANWDGELRELVAFKIPAQFVKRTHTFGRKLYDHYVAFYEQTHDAKCPTWSHPEAKVNKMGTKATLNGKGCSRRGHIYKMTTRKVGKRFLACLWAAWRKLEGLPVSEPYAANIPGHGHIIQPKDWLKEGTQITSDTV